MKKQERDDLLERLQARFARHPNRHAGIAWEQVAARLDANPTALEVLARMEASGGEPDVMGRDEASGQYLFCDCSAESPAERRSLCYDRAAWNARSSFS